MDDIRTKRILVRAWRRGIREMDLILGPFADRHVAAMSSEEIDQFEALLDVPDQDIYDWLMGRSPVPADYDTPMMARLKAFDPSKVDLRGA